MENLPSTGQQGTGRKIDPALKACRPCLTRSFSNGLNNSKGGRLAALWCNYFLPQNLP